MQYFNWLFAHAFIALLPGLVTAAGVAVLGLFVPRGSRMPWVTLMIIAAAIYIMARPDIARSKMVQREDTTEADLAQYCGLQTERSHAALSGRRLFHVAGAHAADGETFKLLFLGLDEKRIRVVPLDPRAAPPREGYVVEERLLPSAPGIHHGIYAVREATSGRLVAEKVFAYALWQPVALKYRIRYIPCDAEGRDRIVDMGMRRIQRENLAEYLAALAKVEPLESRTVEVRAGMEYVARESCAPLVRLGEEFSGAVHLQYTRQGDDLVFAIFAPADADEFKQYGEERRERRARKAGKEKSYRSKYVLHDLLRCKNYFGKDGANAVPVLHAHGRLETPERVIASASARPRR